MEDTLVGIHISVKDILEGTHVTVENALVECARHASEEVWTINEYINAFKSCLPSKDLCNLNN